MYTKLKDSLEWYSNHDVNNSEITDVIEETQPKKQLQEALDELAEQWWLRDFNL